MKYLTLPILSLFSGPLLAHPGHAPGASDQGFLPLVFAAVLVVACLLGYGLYRGRADSAKDDPPDD